MVRAAAGGWAQSGPSHLLRLAWYAAPDDFWTARESAEWVAASLRLLDEFAEAGGRRATVAGTCAEYDWTAAQPLGEEAPLAPASLYGVCKNATRCVAEVLAARSGLALSWARVFFVYGPGEDPPRLIASVTRSLLAGERARISEGRQLRDYIYVDDAAGALVALLTADAEGPVNIGAGKPVTVRTVVERIGAAIGHPELLDLGALPARADDPAVITARTERQREEVVFVPGIALEAGIENTVSWWRRRPEG